MRFRVKHRLGVLAAYLAIHFGVAACSSSGQQEEQGDEISNEEGATEEGGNNTAATEEGEEGADNFAEGEDTSAEGSEEMGNNFPAEDDAGIAASETQNNNLQGIISGMNEGSMEEGSPEAIAQEAVPVETPAPLAEVPAEQSAPVEQVAPVAEVPAATSAPAMLAGNLPEVGSKMPYVVQAGDTLGKIAQKIYGDISYWKEIRDLTSMQNPSRIYPGDVVYYRLDEKSMAFAQSYENQPKSEVNVAAGDTLHSIAKRMGNAKMWRELWRLNDNVENPDVLNVGQSIYYYSNNQQSINSNQQTEESVDAVQNTNQEVTNVNVSKDIQDLESSAKLGFFALSAHALSQAFAG